MLHFRFTCPRHQRDFVEIAGRGGCHDPVEIDEIRRKTLAWLSTRFPRMVLDHFNEQSCLGCKLDVNGVDLKEVECVILDFARRLAARETIPARPLRSRGSS